MTNADNATPFDATPADACEAIASFGGEVLVDLDETLYLRNSTEDFLNSAKPALLALIALRVLDAFRPWRLTGGEATRDIWRLRTVMLLFPWTLWLWRKQVLRLGPQHLNKTLAAVLIKLPRPPTILTVGFIPIVQPLVAAMGLASFPLIAARLSTLADRKAGKLAMAVNSLGDGRVRSALVLTDSREDLPILQLCARPLRVDWPEARYLKALAGVYLPGQYITHVKRPGERYIFRGILQEDFSFWVLSTVALAPSPVMHVVGLVFLLISFWTVYELGYVDNDRVAKKFEASPKLSVAFWSSPVATPRWQPWVWSVLSAVCAIGLLGLPGYFNPLLLLKWIALLLGTYAWFWLYNRYDKATRVWLFPVLQFARSAAFLAVVPCMEIGVAAVGAHIFARWVPYFFYRSGGRNWPDNPSQLVRLLFFVVLALLMAIAVDPAIIANWTAAAILGWCLYRARRELLEMIRKATRIDSET